ncbi:hypothetical protein OPV22_018299 [Ensete ventricosum]|uniref:Uncharacterized protein n=1 Tax=Ensete ventricosum TaxID=4639 RepID=A0AAV8QQ86_ENSVE|nr:hypothetical protein OPV22_018299 [Ensete ventricosum]
MVSICSWLQTQDRWLINNNLSWLSDYEALLYLSNKDQFPVEVIVEVSDPTRGNWNEAREALSSKGLLY